MKKVFKRILPMILVVCILVAGIPASAAGNTNFRDFDYLRIDGKVIFENGTKTGLKIKGASYNAKTKTLTLQNFAGKSIHYYNNTGKKNFTIKLKGHNKLTSYDPGQQYGNSLCVYGGTLTLSGKGKLTLNNTGANGGSSGLVANKLVIKSRLSIVARYTPSLAEKTIVNTKKGGALTIAVKSKQADTKSALRYGNKSFPTIKGNAILKEGTTANKAKQVSEFSWKPKSNGWTTLYYSKRYISIKPK